MRGAEARQNHQIRIPSEQDRARQVFPDARFFVAAVDNPEFTSKWINAATKDGKNLGYTLPPDYRARVLLTMTEATHPHINLRTAPGLKTAADALGIPIEQARDVWKFNRRTWEDDLPVALGIAKRFKQEEQKKIAQEGIVFALSQRPTILENQEKIAARLEEKDPAKFYKYTTSQALRYQKNLARYEKVLRLRQLGHTYNEISVISPDLNPNESKIIASKLNGLGFNIPPHPHPKQEPSDRAKLIEEAVFGIRSQNPSIRGKNLIDDASKGFSTPITKRELKTALQRLVSYRKKLKPALKSFEENIAMIGLYVEEHEKNNPSQPVDKGDLAIFIGVAKTSIDKLLRTFNRRRTASTPQS